MYTQSQITRIKQAMIETQKTINREMAYSPKFRNQDKITDCETHLAKLQAMLDTGNGPVVWTN
jgi:hypothetical protein